MGAATLERIGECELCGLTDHHLVDGICPTCRPKCATVSVGGERGFVAVAREIVSEVVAGAQLAVRNLRGPDDDVADPRTRDLGCFVSPLPPVDAPPQHIDCEIRCADLAEEVALGAEADVRHAVERLREIESDPETRKRLENFRLDTDRR